MDCPSIETIQVAHQGLPFGSQEMCIKEVESELKMFNSPFVETWEEWERIATHGTFSDRMGRQNRLVARICKHEASKLLCASLHQ